MIAESTTSKFREKALRTLNILPPFSPILNRLLSSLANDDIPFNKLAALIEKDTVLAGNVLRVVNSALYGRQGTINSVTHAIAIMGLDKLRNVALSFSVHRIWKSIRAPEGFSVSRFNLHSVATGIMADKLAQCVAIGYPEGAFAAGLFHDIGKLLIALGSAEEFPRLAPAVLATGADAYQKERCLLGCDHAELSAAAMEKWNLPVPIQQAVAYHHNPRASRSSLDSAYEWTLADLVEAATDSANNLGISLAVPNAGIEPNASHEALARLGLADQRDVLLRDFQTEFTMLKAVA